MIMAAETGFADHMFSANPEINQSPSSSVARTPGGNKRKRKAPEQATPSSRGAPTTRRTPSQFASASQQQDDETGALISQFMGSQARGADHTSPNFVENVLRQESANEAASNSGSSANATATTAAAALNYTMTVPPPPAQNFANEPTLGDSSLSGYDVDGQQVTGEVQQGLEGDDLVASLEARMPPRMKPQVGTEEWHKLRKDNHKEVERRRRETINEGINELAKIVPGTEKNKGSILSRAVQFIAKLQEDATNNIDKWTFEKLVTEQALHALGKKLEHVHKEKEAWKKVARDAGVDVDSIDLGLTTEEVDDEEEQDGHVEEAARLKVRETRQDGASASQSAESRGRAADSSDSQQQTSQHADE